MKQTVGKMMGAKAWTLLLLALFALLPKAAMAQKFALIDMEYVLKNVPAYERANEQLNQVSKKWQAEVEALTTEAGTMYKNYQNEVVFLSEEQKKKRQEDIMAKEKQASDLKRKYFGPEGELFKKRTSLMTPIQEEIYTAVKDIADQRGYSCWQDDGRKSLDTTPARSLRPPSEGGDGTEVCPHRYGIRPQERARL